MPKLPPALVAALVLAATVGSAACGAGSRASSADEDRVAGLAADLRAARVHASHDSDAASPDAPASDGPTSGTPPAEGARHFAGVERFAVPLEDAPSRGPADALVTIVEISDFECPFCSRVAPTIEQLLADYPDDVRLVFLHNPLPFHQNATPAALAAIEARRQGGDEAFFRLHDLLFANQRALDRASLERFAGDLGLDVAELGAALDQRRGADVIARDQALAARFGARGTPSFFINGRALRGAQPIDAFRAIIDDEIARARAATDAGLARGDVYAAAIFGAPERGAPAERATPTTPQPDPDAVYRIPVGSEPSRGPADALVTIVVFSDFQCPFCNRVRATIDQVLATYGNDVRFVWMNNPLPFHREALPAAHLALEAYRQRGAQGFWAAHDLLFDNQQALDRSSLEQYARRLRLSMGQVKRALDGTRHRATIDAHQRLAQQVGATGTPTFFINGRSLRGAQPFEAFRDLIDVELQKARDRVQNGTPRAQLYDEIIRNGATSPQTIGGTAAAARPTVPPTPSVYTIPLPTRAPSRGPANARVTIQVFSDFQCPYCGRVRPTVDQILQSYPNDVRIVWRNYPLPFHQDALPAAEAAMEIFEQGGDAKFWAFHDLLFDNQRALTRQSFEQWARQVGGIDMARFGRALDQRTHQARIQDDMDAVRRAGAQIGTPSFFINGTLVQGAQPFESFRDAIDRELGRRP